MKIDFRLINICLISMIFYIICKTSNYWLSILNRCIDIVTPIFLGFFLAYILNPIIVYFEKMKIKRFIGIIIIIVLLFIICFILILFIFPILSKQFFNCAIYVIKIIETNHINLFNANILKLVNKSIDLASESIIILVSCFYFLIDFPHIKKLFKDYIYYKSKKLYCYFSLLNNELHKYIKSFLLISVISFFEYTFFYTLLGHPYALLLGILSSLSNFVPVVGGLFVQIFAIILSFNISKHMGITVLAITIILGIVDAYIINPLVYGKSSQISPLIIIISIFLFGELFGFIGIVFALPIAIVIMHTYKFFHKDAYV